MSLQSEIDSKRAEIKTDAYSMSIGELINLYENGEIDIHPEFQRYFRWSDWQKSQFIESILLGIPIPPIFVAQQQSGIWDVVDGLQRLATIYQLVGILRDQDGNLVQPLVLEATKDLPSLTAKRWELPDDDSPNVLTQSQKIQIKRARFDVSIIEYDSDPRSKFELFQRLNTNGSPLTDQEVRNSILVSINRDLYQWMRRLSEDTNFRDCVAITDRQAIEQYDMELVLRFIVFRTLPEDQLTTTNIGDLSIFLTERMLAIADDNTVNPQEEERAFRRTFEILAQTTGDDSFRRFNVQRGKFEGGFLVTPFEVIGLGIGYNYHLWSDSDFPKVEKKVKAMWNDTTVAKNSGSGVRANTRLPRIVPVGRSLFVP